MTIVVTIRSNRLARQDGNGVLSKEEIDAVPMGDQGDMKGNAEVRSESDIILSYLIHSAVISKKLETRRDIPGSRYLKQCVHDADMVNSSETFGSPQEMFGQMDLDGDGEVTRISDEAVQLLLKRGCHSV